MRQKSFFSWWLVLGVVVLYIISSLFIEEFINELQKFVSFKLLGLFIYMILLVLEIIFAPVTVIPLIPLVTALWGWVIAGSVTLIGWTIGSLCAFLIAKKYGVGLMEGNKNFQRIRSVEKLIPEHHIFLGVVVLRIALPTDLISYGLGLFSEIEWKRYTLATFIGYAPISYVLAYLGSFPFSEQIWVMLLGFLAFVVLIIVIAKDKHLRRKIKSEWNKEFE